MNQNNNNEIGFISCPSCGNDIQLPFKIIRFYISTYKIKNMPTINIHRNLTLNENNKNIINNFCKDTLRNKPFISYIILTKGYHNAITEMAKLELLDQETLEEYLSKNINLKLF